ncbi:unnamed protein product [Sphagnum compactum]
MLKFRKQSMWFSLVNRGIRVFCHLREMQVTRRGCSKYVFVLLVFLTVTMMAAGALQLIFLFKCLEYTTAYSFWNNDQDGSILRIGLVKQEVISWAPRIMLLHNFLSAQECNHLISVARSNLVKSEVVDAQTGMSTESKVRTSTGMSIDQSNGEHPLIQAIEKRIAMYSMIPMENGERLQVLRYEPDQYYKPHHDYFTDEFNFKSGGQRVATMLMYLSYRVEGGETYFPWSGPGECSCGGVMRKGQCVKPKQGDALLFWNTRSDGSTDHNTLHGGCKVLAGEKWLATKWMRQDVFND